mgnify:CR=1 FL=1
MSDLFVDNIKHQSSQGSGTITLGASGETVALASGASQTMAVNKPIFYGELASSQTVTRSTDTKVTGMTNNEVDSNTAFDGTTFTVPNGQGGTYYLKGIVTGDFAVAGQDGEEVRAYIYKNGSSIKEAKIFKNTGGANYADLRRVTVIAETIVSLSASDTVELYARMTDFNASGDGDVVSGQ